MSFKEERKCLGVEVEFIDGHREKFRDVTNSNWDTRIVFLSIEYTDGTKTVVAGLKVETVNAIRSYYE